MLLLGLASQLLLLKLNINDLPLCVKSIICDVFADEKPVQVIMYTITILKDIKLEAWFDNKVKSAHLSRAVFFLGNDKSLPTFLLSSKKKLLCQLMNIKAGKTDRP